jgi:hypothetical protein
VTVTGVDGRVSFQLRDGWSAGVEPTAIVVLEVQQGGSAREVCVLSNKGIRTTERAKVTQWVYGEDLAPYHLEKCERLNPGMLYRVIVVLTEGRGLSTEFRIQDDGKVVDLRRS